MRLEVLIVADNLGKFEHEVMQLTPHEIARWMAFYKIRDKEIERSRAHARPRKPRK